MTTIRTITVDTAPVTVHLVWAHWLPRLFGAGAVTLGRRVYFKRAPTEIARPAPILVAHELIHVAQYVRWGALKYFGAALWQFVRHRRKANRPLEQQAEREAPSLLSELHPSIAAPWIREVVYGGAA